MSHSSEAMLQNMRKKSSKENIKTEEKNTFEDEEEFNFPVVLVKIEEAEEEMKDLSEINSKSDMEESASNPIWAFNNNDSENLMTKDGDNTLDIISQKILNDDELIASVREESVEEEDDNVEVETEEGPSASEALACLETALNWMEHQPECEHMQLLTVKRMCDLAARKQVKAARQLTLTEMFNKK